jgi:glycosyltransferase involved in cell wall biosynthesis
MADAILDILSDEASRQRMAAAARVRARSLFDHRAIIDEWEELLTRISDHNGKA